MNYWAAVYLAGFLLLRVFESARTRYKASDVIPCQRISLCMDMYNSGVGGVVGRGVGSRAWGRTGNDVWDGV